MTLKFIDPQKFGLTKRVKLCNAGKEGVDIIIERKSRLIMKDGIKIIATANQIKGSKKIKTVSLKTSAPVCSKTKSLLIKNNIEVKVLKSV